jgi:hypothetical protein
MLDVIEWVRLFLSDPERLHRTSQRAWRQFANKHEGAPSWSALDRLGGLRQLLAEAARPDWERRARAIDAQRPKHEPKPRPRAGQRPQRTPALERRAFSERADAIVALLRSTRQTMTAKQIAVEIGVGGRSVRYYLQALVACERIDPARHVYGGNRTTTGYRYP